MFLNGGSGKDKLTGGAGADTLYGLGGDDSLSGLGGEDVLAGNDGNDTLSGGANDDYLMGGLGNDRIDGGTGNDWAGYEDATSAVKVDLALTTAQNTLGAGTDQLNSIEYVYGSSYGDTLSGTSGFNYIFGGEGNDSLMGRGGDDFLAGGAGDDTVDGGANDDTVSFDDGVAGGVVVNLITQTADGHGHDNLVSIESVYGSTYGDTITGSAGDNYLAGNGGGDVISGEGGNDVIDTGAGGATIRGGDGDDFLVSSLQSNSLDGGAGSDTVTYENFQTGVRVVLGEGEAQAFNMAGSDHLNSVENVIGTASDDHIIGDAGDNFISGGDGRDGLFGGSGGRDVLDCGAGDDYIYAGGSSDLTAIGGAGNDSIYFFDSSFVSSGVTVDLAATGSQQIDATHALTISGFENFTGTAGADTVYANDDANRFYTFGGVDTFVFRTLASIGNGSTSDMISRMIMDPDPNPGAPWGAIIDVSAIDADATQAGNQAFHLLAQGAAFTGHAGEITRNWSSQQGGYAVELDVDGDAVADARLMVYGGVSVADANFIL
ncbi:calcium-binding protein [Phenylobacterium sp.]|uniref:calcium-binding protein n=1 Tax=Phenylobacterium sp. TaxID=1871053 RepID=UPI003BAC6525